ncbi:hypothetical protein Tsubulata_009196, partial [Turnera subulata]
MSSNPESLDEINASLLPLGDDPSIEPLQINDSNVIPMAKELPRQSICPCERIGVYAIAWIQRARFLFVRSFRHRIM